MIYKRWAEENPEGLALGVEQVIYGPPTYGWGEPATRLGKILPDYQGEEFTSEGFQTPHYIGIFDVLEGKESLKYIKDWPKPARLEAGRFLRHVWRTRRSLRERGLLI